MINGQVILDNIITFIDINYTLYKFMFFKEDLYVR